MGHLASTFDSSDVDRQQHFFNHYNIKYRLKSGTKLSLMNLSILSWRGGRGGGFKEERRGLRARIGRDHLFKCLTS